MTDLDRPSAGQVILNPPTGLPTFSSAFVSAQLVATPCTAATANQVSLLLHQNTASADLGTLAVNDVYALQCIVGTRVSTSGVGRVKFEYRTL